VTDGEVDADTEVASCEGQSRSRCVRTLALGRRFGCAALRDRTVWCWGRNDESQLGYESSDLCPERLADGQTRAVSCHRFPQQVVGLANVTAISAGGAHACADASPVGARQRHWCCAASCRVRPGLRCAATGSGRAARCR
jgi:alpha-tubulin suppressor-like RCC1 family protein